jgi:ABC transport system ATP-binding/permease protein
MQHVIEALGKLKNGQSLVIGTHAGSGLNVVAPGVEKQHARVLRRETELLVQDLDSSTGTFVNGQEVRGLVALRAGDRLCLGSLEVVIPAGASSPVNGSVSLVAPIDLGQSAALAVSMSRAVKTIKGASGAGGSTRNILDDVSFQLEAGEFLGILGASGSGKSTLVKSLAGLVDLTEGAILLDGAQVSTQSLRNDRRIAYMPQDVVIHEALTSRLALEYIARLKELGNSALERRQLVLDALSRVDLAEHHGTPIYRLSGGQRKRAALAAELLGDPKLILLDEATSGLDPATEAEMMELFRALAREGRTVVCITHFPGRLHMCDRLLYLMKGKCVFDGTPEQLKRFFGVTTIEGAYTSEDAHKPAEWQAEFRKSSVGQSAAGRLPAVPAGQEPIAALSLASNGAQRLRQASVLTARYARLQGADFKNLLLVFAQAPAIALMLAVTFGSITSRFAEQHASDTKQVIFVLVVAVLWCSGTAGVREIVKEAPILAHETRFGVGLAPYLVSKLGLLGLISLTQTFVLLWTVRYFTELTSYFGVQFLVLALTGLVGVALGLLVSAVSGTSERAMTVLPVLLIAQAIFSSGLARLTGGVKVLAQLLVPAFWSLDGLKSQLSSDLLNARYPGAPGQPQPPILGADGPLVFDLLALIIQGALLVGTTYLVLRAQAHDIPSRVVVARLRRGVFARK